MKCQECGLELRPVVLTAYGYPVEASTGAFKICGVEEMACPKCGKVELRLKNPEKLWKTEK